MEKFVDEYVVEDIAPDNLVCGACLSNDRDLYSLNNIKDLIEIFQLIMYDHHIMGEDFSVDNYYDKEVYICWECRGLMQRFCKFRRQVHNAQDYLHGLTNGTIIESQDHTYTSKSLSSLEMVNKTEFDRSYVDVSDQKKEYKILSTISSKQPIPVHLRPLLAPRNVFSKPEIITETNKSLLETNTLSGYYKCAEIKSSKTSGTFNSDSGKSNTIDSASFKSDKVFGDKVNNRKCVYQASRSPIICRPNNVNATFNSTGITKNKKTTSNKDKIDTHYVTEHMTEDDMVKSRELSKQQPIYLHAPFKCMLCIIVLETEELLEEHFMTAHNVGEGQIACPICHQSVDERVLSAHTCEHYLRYMCKHCAHVEYNVALIRRHIKTHSNVRRGVRGFKGRRKNGASESSDVSEEFPVAGVKRVRDSYPCPECDIVFKQARKLRTHIDRNHRAGIICDNCKRRFVNKTTLIEHLRLFCPVVHPGPPPEDMCPICHKLVKVVYLKGHIRRHNNKKTYECKECDNRFSHYTNYIAHLKYSRAHATEFKYRCPMCEKGYTTKAIMQDHFNYQHLGKSSHKCPICDKTFATRRCVVQHVRRVHQELDDGKAVRYICSFCGQCFKCKSRLREHTRVHTS